MPLPCTYQLSVLVVPIPLRILGLCLLACIHQSPIAPPHCRLVFTRGIRLASLRTKKKRLRRCSRYWLVMKGQPIRIPCLRRPGAGSRSTTPRRLALLVLTAALFLAVARPGPIPLRVPFPPTIARLRSRSPPARAVHSISPSNYKSNCLSNIQRNPFAHCYARHDA